MKRGKRFNFTQPITRVHNIFRIRTIVNAVTAQNKKGKLPNDEEIALVLARHGLSKYRKEKVKDRIMRRARDHLLTASYLGLLTRSGFPFGYSSTQEGKLLKKYGWEEECPKDSLEEAVFIDKILRLKLTNVYDLQRGKQYEKMRSRPCLYILHVLSRKDWLHEHQIAVATGGKRCDPILEDRETRAVVTNICKFGNPSEDVLSKFYHDYGVKDEDRRNMTRNIRPLLDWCQSVGLVEYREMQSTGRWYRLTDRGKNILEQYGERVPIWYMDLGTAASAKSALLIFYQFALSSGFVFDGLLNSHLRIGLITTRVAELVSDIDRKVGVNLVNVSSARDTTIDFTLEYDVPPDHRKEVLQYLKKISKIANIKVGKIVEDHEKRHVEDLERVLDREHQTIKKIITRSFSQNTAISSDPLLNQIPALVPSVGVLGQYKSEFEKEVVILLRLVGFNAIKYQGQLADRAHKAHVVRFFENNPDILVKNGIESLVECKSSGEWKSPLATEKSIPKELLIYQQYFPEIHSDSVALVYEGTIDTDSRKFLLSVLTDSKDIVFVTKNYLINCVHQPIMRDRLVRTIKTPNKYRAEDRIL